MRVLLVEDDDFKKDRLLEVIHKFTSDVDIATSVHSAIQFVNSNVYNLVVLDMALPSHGAQPGGGPTSSMLSGGVEVIAQISYVAAECSVVIVTQYPEIELDGRMLSHRKAVQKLRTEFGIDITDVIKYAHETSDWAGRLREILGGQ